MNYSIALLLLLHGICLNSQSIVEKLGGVETHFEFETISGPLQVQSQAVIKRSKKNYSNAHHIPDFATETFHLEFIILDKIDIEPVSYHLAFFKPFYEVTFLSQANDTLAVKKIKYSSEKNDSTTRNSFMLDLGNTPLLILDETKTIHIKKMVK